MEHSRQVIFQVSNYYLIMYKISYEVVAKNLLVHARDIRYLGSIPGQEDPLEEGMATLQYSCLENPMDRGVRHSSGKAEKERRPQQK